MQTLQAFVLQAFYRILRFLEELQAAGTPKVDKLRTELVAVISGMERFTREQEAADQESRRLTTVIRAQRQTLVAVHLQPIARAAQRVLGWHRGESTGFEMPGLRDGVEMLLVQAHTFAEGAAAYETQFVEYGLAPDFIVQLQKAALDLRTSLDARGRAHSRRVGATESIAKAVDEGRALVRLIDAVVVAALQGDRGRLAEWRTTMRVVNAPGSRATRKEGDAEVATRAPAKEPEAKPPAHEAAPPVHAPVAGAEDAPAKGQL